MDLKTIQKLFNPVRMKIIFTLNTKKECTTKDLQKELSDVPQASLYRHISSLVEVGIIEVVNEKKIRGALQRTFRLKYNPYDKINQQAVDGDKDSVNQVFFQFIMAQLGEFTHYLYKENTNLAEDGVGFRSYPIYMTEEEHLAFVDGLGKLIRPYVKNISRKDRRLRKFSFIYMPGEES